MLKIFLSIYQFARIVTGLFVMVVSVGNPSYILPASQPKDPMNCVYITGKTYSTGNSQFGLLNINDGTFTAINSRAYYLPKTQVPTIPEARSPRYVSYIEYDKEVYVQTIEAIDGSERVELPVSSHNRLIYWSPDDKFLAYLDYDADTSENFVVIANSNGQDRRIFPADRLISPARFFSWSPDSAYIAIEQGIGAGSNLTFVSVNDLQPRSFRIHEPSRDNFIWQAAGHQLAYAWQSTNLSLINPDTANEQIVQTTGDQIENIVWSPDGRYVFTSIQSSNLPRRRLRLDIYGSNGFKVVGVGLIRSGWSLPAWSRDGNRLFFEQPDRNVLLEYDVEHRTYEMIASDIVAPVFPTPDNQGVIMEQKQHDRFAVTLYKISDRHLTTLIDNLDQDIELYWLANDTVLTAVTKQYSTYNVDIIDINTLKSRRLIDGLSNPAWIDWSIVDSSPDQIAFWRKNTNDEIELESYYLTGVRIFSLKVNTLGKSSPDSRINWSPDHHLAAVILTDGNDRWSLQIASPDGKLPTVIGRKLGSDFIAWSSDSTKIAFIQSSASDYQTLEIVGSDGRRILSFRLFDQI